MAVRRRDWLAFDDEPASDPEGPVVFSDALIAIDGEPCAVSVLSYRHATGETRPSKPPEDHPEVRKRGADLVRRGSAPHSELEERAPSSRSQEMTFSCLVLGPLAASSGVPCA
jgi:hypothetical protein